MVVSFLSHPSINFIVDFALLAGIISPSPHSFPMASQSCPPIPPLVESLALDIIVINSGPADQLSLRLGLLL